jgi:glyoxylase-like metal-dependent hydrolase (beta-lactamase superfamily II)
MKYSIIKRLILLTLLLFLFTCSTPKDFIVLHQVTGPIETNCYLLYDLNSKEAALFDVGGAIDTLLAQINSRNLELKHILITHCHPDHIVGVPLIKEKYPDVKICFTKEEYDDMNLYSQWEKKLDPKEVEEAKKDPELLKIMNFDYNTIGEPDIYLKDNQTLKLGNLKIKTIKSPGHSRGGMCYSVGNVLFSGDVLFYRTVGRTDLEGGSKEELIKSVRRLYSLLPDEVIVYPGHGESTDIGSEKKENKRIRLDSVQ